MNTDLPKQPHCYLSLDQVRESGLLSPARMAEVEAAIESRISIPRDEQGRPIETARLADLTPWPSMLYVRMQHDEQWLYLRREIMAVVLTEQEREFLDRHAFSAASARRDAERFEKATKLTADQWDGWVTDGDRYWQDLGSYFDDSHDRSADGEEPHAHRYLWAAVPQQVIVGRAAQDVFECQMDDRGWEDIDPSAFTGWEDLQKAIDLFVERNAGVVSYVPDYTRAVLLVEVVKPGDPDYAVARDALACDAGARVDADEAHVRAAKENHS